MKLAFDSSVWEVSKNETEREYVKSDCADTCTYKASDDTKIYSFTPCGIQTTTFVCSLVLLVYQRMLFSRLGIPNDVDWIRIFFMIADSSLPDNSNAF